MFGAPRVTDLGNKFLNISQSVCLHLSILLTGWLMCLCVKLNGCT